jgi:hypothetical protein
LARAGLRNQRVRIVWLLTLAITLAVFAALAPRAFAGTFAYTVSGNPHTGTVVCYSNTQTCDIYPESSIGTSGWAPRNFNDASWSFPPYSKGGVVYINTSGGWIASATATTVDSNKPRAYTSVQSRTPSQCAATPRLTPQRTSSSASPPIRHS